MTFLEIVFYVFSAVLVVSSLLVVTVRNPVRAALFLVLAFFSAACLWLTLEAEFLAITLVLVYVGAVMVLFLFVIMLLGAEQLRQPTHKLRSQQPLAIVLVLTLLGIAGYVVAGQVTGARPVELVNAPGYGSPVAIGYILFQNYLFPFEATSLLLLVAMVGVVVLTGVDERRRRRRRSRRS